MTAFDWYVSYRPPSFMAFYNDETGLDAVKLLLNRSGPIWSALAHQQQWPA